MTFINFIQADFLGGHKFCSEKIRNCDPKSSLTSKSLTFMRRERISGYSTKVAAVKYHTSTSYQQLKSQITCEQVPHDVISPHTGSPRTTNQKWTAKSPDAACLMRNNTASIDLRCAREKLEELHIIGVAEAHKKPPTARSNSSDHRQQSAYDEFHSWDSQNRLSDQVTRRSASNIFEVDHSKNALWAQITVLYIWYPLSSCCWI